MARVTALWRHPIKSHGREAVETVVLEAGKTMPWDRHWAVTHDASKFDATTREWVSCANFMRGMTTPALAGIWAELNDNTGELTLRHQQVGSVTFDPESTDGQLAFFDWIKPLVPEGGRQPAALVSSPGRGMTDGRTAALSIMTTASHEAVEAAHGSPLETERWRGNLWLEGTDAWEEFDWIGHDIRIGEVRFHIRKPIERCAHTMANPFTGKRDADLPRVLRSAFQHEDFGVQAVVVQGGRVSVGDTCEVL